MKQRWVQAHGHKKMEKISKKKKTTPPALDHNNPIQFISSGFYNIQNLTLNADVQVYTIQGLSVYQDHLNAIDSITYFCSRLYKKGDISMDSNMHG
jgi:hypothetical protein